MSLRRQWQLQTWLLLSGFVSVSIPVLCRFIDSSCTAALCSQGEMQATCSQVPLCFTLSVPLMLQYPAHSFSKQAHEEPRELSATTLSPEGSKRCWFSILYMGVVFDLTVGYKQCCLLHIRNVEGRAPQKLSRCSLPCFILIKTDCCGLKGKKIG